jgi:uncharacterized protein (TIGR00730 family)
MIAQSGIPVITGGGPGVMEAANRGAFEAGGQSIGLNIQLPHEQFVNQYVTESMEFEYFFARKVILTMSSKIYVYMPGGYGTVDELGEILVLMQENKMTKTPIYLVGESFWQPLDNFFKAKMEDTNSFIGPDDRRIYKITNNLEEIVAKANEMKDIDTSSIMQAVMERGQVLRNGHIDPVGPLPTPPNPPTPPSQ